MPTLHITGTGRYLPAKVLTNSDLEQIVDTSDEWITTRTGIKTRHRASKEETTSFMGSQAALKALENAGASPDEIDIIIVATATPDMNFPSTACMIQAELGLKNAVGFDISAACSGYLYALSIAENYLKNNRMNKALIVCSERFSDIVDWADRSTCVLFGDGAAASLLEKKEKSDTKSRGIIETVIRSDGSYNDLLNVPEKKFVQMKGNSVFKIAIRTMSEICNEVMNKAKVTKEDVKLVIPHQANIRIINALAEHLKLKTEQVVCNVASYGNTSAATIPIALDEVNRNGELHKGDILLLVAFGGGFTWGASLIEW